MEDCRGAGLTLLGIVARCDAVQRTAVQISRYMKHRFLATRRPIGLQARGSGFFAVLAAVDTANPYGPMGGSRTRMVGFLAEPVFIVVFLTVSFVAGSTIPYIVQQR